MGWYNKCGSSEAWRSVFVGHDANHLSAGRSNAERERVTLPHFNHAPKEHNIHITACGHTISQLWHTNLPTSRTRPRRDKCLHARLAIAACASNSIAIQYCNIAIHTGDGGAAIWHTLVTQHSTRLTTRSRPTAEKTSLYDDICL